MITESSNTSAQSDAAATTNHLLKGKKNELILTLNGSALMVRHMVDDARRFGKANAFCHAKFAPDPEHPLTPQELLQAAKDYATARGFEDRDALIVAHQKDGLWHAHAAFRLVDPLTGRVARTSWDYLQNEKFSRQFEYDHGHRITRGQHTPSVCRALVREGRPEAAAAIRAAAQRQPEPGPSTSFRDIQRAERVGLDKQEIKRLVSQAYEASSDRQQLLNALAKHGWAVTPGKKPGVLLLTDEAGRELGNLQRLSPARKKAFEAFWSLPVTAPPPDQTPPLPQSLRTPQISPSTTPEPQEPPHEATSPQVPAVAPTAAGSAPEDLARHPSEYERDTRPARPDPARETRRGAGPLRRDDASHGVHRPDTSADQIKSGFAIERNAKDAAADERNKERAKLKRRRFEAGYHRHRARLNALAYRHERQAERERKALSRAERYARDNPIFLGFAALATRLTGINFIPEKYTKLFKIAEDARAKRDGISHRLETLRAQAQRAAESRLPDTDEPARKRQEQYERRDRIERRTQENIIKSQEESRRISIAEERNISKRSDNTNEHTPAPGR
ncbi:hypothetical protein NBRC3222_2674 [Acetobacter pasteurianus NBRC 3222]|nr:hypothetical protein NBRC3222_2674 [Acetobacter pasteurianus NBRC 3222]